MDTLYIASADNDTWSFISNRLTNWAMVKVLPVRSLYIGDPPSMPSHAICSNHKQKGRLQRSYKLKDSISLSNILLLNNLKESLHTVVNIISQPSALILVRAICRDATPGT